MPGAKPGRPARVRITEESISDLAAYETVSIAFEVNARLRLDEFRARGALVFDPIEPWWKDYDACEEDRPTSLARRFDMSNWGILSAFEDDRRLGGAIIARDTPGCDMLEGRDDLAVIFDFRVAPGARGKGLGQSLFQQSINWSKAHGCSELRVETQDNNVAACRFYSAMGCGIHSIEERAYGPAIDEAKLIWRVRL